MKTIEINKKSFEVEETEFSTLKSEYTVLNILEKAGQYERIISLIVELSQTMGIANALFVSPTHGGYVPIECSKNLQHIFIHNCLTTHKTNILKNKIAHDVSNVYLIDDLNDINPKFQKKMILIMNELISDYNNYINENNPILITTSTKSFTNYTMYQLKNLNLFIYIPQHYHSLFLKEFSYYLEENSHQLNYDNLINICIMVKNAGPLFEEVLTKNLPYMDRWTILDTGSTDETIEIINKVLVGKKKGQLFQEPFINFGESRNRCLELAGTTCKFNIMLDDTYTLGGYLRDFLIYVRGDQISDSFSLYINQNDIEYASNRIFKSAKNLKYKYSIHEVIQDQDNMNVIIPNNQAHIYDIPSQEMAVRTSLRKEKDIEMLLDEIKKNPFDPRPYYYLGQTYNYLQNHEKSFEYYVKRGNHCEEGFIQEKVDAFFEAGRIANFYLNKPWEECEALYKKAYELDRDRPESLYFIGVHYFMKDDINAAYPYFLKAYQNGYPIHRQYCLKPSISYEFVPKFLTLCCYDKGDYENGEKASTLFLEKNKPTSENYSIVLDWNKIFVLLNKSRQKLKKEIVINYPSTPLCIFVAPGGFKHWTGKDILTNGMGGSETYIVEMTRHIKSSGNFSVVVFCNCVESDIFEGVLYQPLEEYYAFVHCNYIHSCFISRYSEFLPVALNGQVENVYLVAHDLTLTGKIIPFDRKLKKVFCLSDWHVEHFIKEYPLLKDICVPFSHGMNFDYIQDVQPVKKIPYKFIYSSYANRGLIFLLMMWEKIIQIEPSASLHIYSDINSEYMMNNFAELMGHIKQLLNKLQNMNVYYHGWVNKKTLMESWMTADVWFYPCVFAETFCLTAFEAAATRTLAVTTNLAALNNTVGDRGVLIEGNPDSEEWMNNAINKLFETLNNKDLKQHLIDKNYNWVSKFTWKQRANEMMEKYLLPQRLEYRGMYNWTNDVPQGSRNVFESVIQYFNKTHHQHECRVLEIGTFAGTSLVKIVEMIPGSKGTGVDTWTNYNENENTTLSRIEETQVVKSFLKNVMKSGLETRIVGLKQESSIALLNMIKMDEKYDFIYVDGSHKLLDCYTDMVLAWKLLNKGGIMGIDDYLWNNTDVLNSPFEAVNAFLKKYEKELVVLSKEYRVFLEKK
jgi:predicted O-methyltransferase YrrM/tetratricopeptide (TPR) repeat protein